MVIFNLALLLAAPPQKLSAGDTAFTARIHQAVAHMSDKKTAFVRFEKTVSKSDAIRCNQMLPKVALNSNAYAECAFVQAYYGIDYDANLQRIIRPYRIWHTHSDQWSKEYHEDNNQERLTDIDGVYTALNWLYLKHHDLKSLGTWEDLELDGAPAEGSADELFDLWNNHAADMLRAAYGHPKRIKSLAAVLGWGYEAPDDKDHTEEEAADVRPHLHSKDKRVASAAAALIRELKN